jgi:hypothetical protein
MCVNYVLASSKITQTDSQADSNRCSLSQKPEPLAGHESAGAPWLTGVNRARQLPICRRNSGAKPKPSQEQGLVMIKQETKTGGRNVKTHERENGSQNRTDADDTDQCSSHGSGFLKLEPMDPCARMRLVGRDLAAGTENGRCSWAMNSRKRSSAAKIKLDLTDTGRQYRSTRQTKTSRDAAQSRETRDPLADRCAGPVGDPKIDKNKKPTEAHSTRTEISTRETKRAAESKLVRSPARK